MGWENYPTGANFASTPAGMQAVFDRVPSKRLGLEFDPSHFVRQYIDPVRVAWQFKDRILAVHAKDTEIIEPVLQQVGIAGDGWWRYRIPGQGIVNWPAFLTVLLQSSSMAASRWSMKTSSGTCRVAAASPISRNRAKTDLSWHDAFWNSIWYGSRKWASRAPDCGLSERPIAHDAEAAVVSRRLTSTCPGPPLAALLHEAERAQHDGVRFDDRPPRVVEVAGAARNPSCPIGAARG